MPSLSAPLWPAGHLPLNGGDRMPGWPSPVVGGAGCAAAPKLPISPLEGEMAGRPEGGAS
ncbi:lytic murein transglycosylase [Mesorhizobium sp. M00.F.Ca.ET.216.01.1.1]|nr:lytic murein transglycosylase [Mesorhizobium sp. M00.F.Ca.ET.216.01.1.1]TIS53863.1 MAG: lytic murein transglycosylase [Mesorhizobium sp.]TIS86535.1 MAG: lytic murein transglycosylase [Mesorhizobium sp.]